MGDARINIEPVFPFWMRPYLFALWLFDCMGLVEADPDIAAEFIAKHTTYRITEPGES